LIFVSVTPWLLGWLVFTIAVPVAIWVGDLIPTEYANGEKLVQAIITSAIVIPIVYLLDKRRWGKEIFKKMRISTTIRGVSTNRIVNFFSYRNAHKPRFLICLCAFLYLNVDDVLLDVFKVYEYGWIRKKDVLE